MRAFTPIPTLPRLTPPPTLGAEAGAASTPPLAAPTDTTMGCARDHDDLVQALTAYVGPNRPENGYATLIASARRCGWPGAVPVIGWAKQRVATWARICGIAEAELASVIAGAEVAERMMLAGVGRWAIGSENGAA